MKKKYRVLLFSGIIFFVLICIPIFIFIFNTMPVTNEKNEISERIEIPSGMSIKSFASILKEKNLIKNEKVFYLVARYNFFRLLAGSVRLKFESGVYVIKSSMSVADIFYLISSGKQDFLRVSFPEGLTISKIAQRLESANVCSAEDFKNVANKQELIEKYNIPSTTIEGYLFPDTYFFTSGMEAKDVAIIMIDNFFSKIKEIKEFNNLSSKEFYDNLILASIVEREYRAKDEAPIIASVFKNRIAKNIGLYSCATVEYIITEIQGKEHPSIITYEDLKIDSPYNTYKWAALPPTPISNPGIVSLNAVINSPKTNYYYFRLVDAAAGRHVFSEEFSDHVREGTLFTKEAVKD